MNKLNELLDSPFSSKWNLNVVSHWIDVDGISLYKTFWDATSYIDSWNEWTTCQKDIYIP